MTWQELTAGADEPRRQLEALNVPPPPLSLQETLPAGKIGEDEVSMTDPVTVTEPPGATEEEFIETVVFVACCATVSAEVPELVPRIESPE